MKKAGKSRISAVSAGFLAAAALFVTAHEKNGQKYGPDGYPVHQPSADFLTSLKGLFSPASSAVRNSVETRIDPEEAEIAAIVTDEFMDAVAHSESSGRADATNPNSSATGKFQFIEATFLEQLYRHGATLGYGHLAAPIERVATGEGDAIEYNYVIRDPATRARVLDARNDPVLSERLARVFISDNLRELNDQLPDSRIPMSEAVAYMTHHFGVDGTVEIVEALEENPNAPFRSVVGRPVCNSNEAICYRLNGRPRTVAEVHSLLQTRLDSAPG